MTYLASQKESVEKLRKKFLKTLGDNYIVETNTEVSSFYGKSFMFDIVIFKNNKVVAGILVKQIFLSVRLICKSDQYINVFKDAGLRCGILYFGKDDEFYLWTDGKWGYQKFDFDGIVNSLKDNRPVGDPILIDELAVEILSLLPDKLDDVECHHKIDQLFKEGNVNMDKLNGYISFDSVAEDFFFKAILPQKKISKACRYTSLQSLFLLLKDKRHCMCSLTCMNDKGETSYADNYVGNGTYAENYQILEENNNCYILSCCADSKQDNLTMWRLYGCDAKGVCLRYKVNENLVDNKSFFFAPVSYGSSEKEHLELEFINNILNWTKNGWRFKFNRWHIWKHFFKSYLFKDENEIRLLYVHNNDIEIERCWIMDSKNSIASRLCLFDIDKDIFPLKVYSAIIGPNCNQQASNVAQFNYMNMQQNVIPFKSWNEAIVASKIRDYR